MPTTKKNEVKAELLIGRAVVDAAGKKIGRIEEIIAEREGDELVVKEFHVGAFAFRERFSVYHFGVGILRLFGARARLVNPRKIAWDELDLSDPEHPRLV